MIPDNTAVAEDPYTEVAGVGGCLGGRGNYFDATFSKLAYLGSWKREPISRNENNRPDVHQIADIQRSTGDEQTRPARRPLLPHSRILPTPRKATEVKLSLLKNT